LVAAVQVAQEATLQQEKELTALIQYFQQLLPQAVAVRVAFQLQVILAVLVVVMALKHQEAAAQALLIKDLLVEVLLMLTIHKAAVAVEQVPLEPMAQMYQLQELQVELE
jgi:hypothetical protein